MALDKLDKIGPEGVDGELANRGIEEQARNALLQVFLPPDPARRDARRVLPRVAAFVTAMKRGSARSRTCDAIMELVGADERRAAR